MRTSIQRRRLAESDGIFDVAGSTGVAAPPPKAPTPAPPKVTPEPKTAEAPKEPSVGKGSEGEVDGYIAAADAVKTAAAALDNASAFLMTLKGVGDAATMLDKGRSDLLKVSSVVKSILVKKASEDPTVAEKVRAWLTDLPVSKGDLWKPKNTPPAPPAPLPTPLPDAPVAPAAPPAPPAPPSASAAVPPAPPAPGAAGPTPSQEPIPIPDEGFLRSVDRALFEQGLTKERPEASKRKTLVWQPEKTGTKSNWYTKGVKGNGYGSGGKFNNH